MLLMAASFMPMMLLFIFIFVAIFPMLIYDNFAISLHMARKGFLILAVLGPVSLLANGYAISRFRSLLYLADLVHLGIMWPIYAPHLQADIPTYFYLGEFGTSLSAVEFQLVHDPCESLPKNPPVPGHEMDQGTIEYQHLIGHWYERSEQF